MEDEEDEDEEEEEQKPNVQPDVIRVPPPTYNSAGYPQHAAYRNPGYVQSAAGYAQSPAYAQNPAFAQTLAFQQSMMNPQGFAQRAGYGALPQHMQVGRPDLHSISLCSLV